MPAEGPKSLQLLGPLSLTDSDGKSLLSVLSQPKRVAILAYLSSGGSGVFHRRDKLLALFWPESDEKRARGALRQTLYFLRRSLGEGVLTARGDQEIGIDASVLRCDVAALEDAVARGDLAEALALYRGDFLNGFHVPDLPDFEWWVEQTRERLRREVVAAAEKLTSEARASGDIRREIEFARVGVALSPLNAPSVCFLVEALGQSGDVAAAVAVCESFEERFTEELGLDPPTEVRDAVRRLYQGSVSQERAGDVRIDPVAPSGAVVALAAVPVVTDIPAPADPGLSELKERSRSRRWGPLLFAAAVGVVISVALGIGAGADPTLPYIPGRSRVLVSVADARSLWFLPSRGLRGLDDEISRALVRSEDFAPLARKAPADVDPRTARGEFEADFVLSGSVQGDRAAQEVSVQLIDTRTELVVWSERYDVPPESGRRWQEEVSRSVVRAMTRQVGGDQVGSSLSEESAGTANREAYFAFWDGRALWHQRQHRLMVQALRSFRRATQLDTDFAEPHAAIADIYNLLGAYDYGIQRPADAFPIALASARAAIDRDPGLGEAWAALAFAMGSFEWDFEGAREAFERAFTERPDYAPAHHWYSLMLLVEGRHEDALFHIERAWELDPASPVIRTAVGRHYYYLRDYERAISHYEQALLMDPDFPPAHIEDIPLVMAMRGHLLALEGEREAAEAVALRLERMRGWMPPEYRAIVRMGLGDPDQAVEFLEAAYEERSAGVLFLELDPMLDPLRGNPRFEALIDRVRSHAD
jgi:DNA-binding SARP family transcriptional activator